MTNSSHKLQACLNHDLVDTDKNLPAAYIAACRRWYDALTATDKATVAVVRATLDKDDEPGAEKIAAQLPSAPKCPL
jgi:hypothetical protein